MILLPQKVAYRGTISGLRISAVDGTAFIDNLSGATLDLGSSVVKATGTAAIRISSVDGTAFVDTADATLAAALAANAGKYLVITDASGRYLKGWIKAAGTGETLGADVLAGFDFTSGWGTTDAAIVDANTFNATSEYGFVYKLNVFTQGSLYKGSFDAVNSAGVSEVRQSGGARLLADGETGSYSNAAAVSRTILIRSNAISTVDVATLTLEPVLTPSTDGCTIVSTKGGTTYNFESKDASFTYNAASYTYTIYDRDVTALADGNHLVEIYDTSGRLLRGYLAAAGSGEALGDELVDAWTNWGDYPYETFTAAGNAITQAVNSTGYGAAYKTLGDQTGKLVKCVNSYVLTSGDAPDFGLTNVSLSEFSLLALNGTSYATWISSQVNMGMRNLTVTDFAVPAFSLKQLTAPSTSGATIVSEKGGATANWAYKDAAFTFNNASYYCVVRAAR
jgi:hypothetical protein